MRGFAQRILTIKYQVLDFVRFKPGPSERNCEEVASCDGQSDGKRGRTLQQILDRDSTKSDSNATSKMTEKKGGVKNRVGTLTLGVLFSSAAEPKTTSTNTIVIRNSIPKPLGRKVIFQKETSNKIKPGPR